MELDFSCLLNFLRPSTLGLTRLWFQSLGWVKHLVQPGIFVKNGDFRYFLKRLLNNIGEKIGTITTVQLRKPRRTANIHEIHLKVVQRYFAITAGTINQRN